MKKIFEKTLKNDSSQINLFALELDGFNFPSSRRFQEVPYLSEASHLVVLTEHFNSADTLSGDSRLVIFDLKNRDQWMTCWHRWSCFQDIKIKCASNNKGQIEFNVKRTHRDIQFKETHSLPFLKNQLIPWEHLEIPLQLDSTSTMNSVSFDSARIQVTEEPGPVHSESYWSDIERILIIRVIEPDYAWTHLDLFGSQILTISLPCNGATPFIEELSKRFQIKKEDIDQTIGSFASKQQLLWTKNSTVAKSNEAITPFQIRDFENGFSLNGQNIPWDISFQELKSHPLFKRSKLYGTPILQSKHPVQIANLVLPKLYVYTPTQNEDYASPQTWNFDCLDFSPKLTDGKLTELLQPLMTNPSSWIKQSPFECLIFNEKIEISLDHLTGIWRGHFSLSHSFYWSVLRAKSPETLKLKVSAILDIKASTTRIDVSHSNGMKPFPSPELLYQKELCFWKDSSQDIQGLTVGVESIKWDTGHLQSLTCETFQQDGDRGDTITYHILEISLTKNRKLNLELSEFLNENECKNMTNWLRNK